MPSSVEFLPLSAIDPGLGLSASPMHASVERLAIQAGHRLAAISIFATLAAWAFLYQGQSDRWAVAIALAASDLGICSALFARGMARWERRRPAEETISIFIINLVLLVLSLQLMLFSRLDFFRAAIEQFFSQS